MKKLLKMLCLLLFYPPIFIAGIFILSFQGSYTISKWLSKYDIKDEIEDIKEEAFESFLYPIALYRRIYK